MERIAVIGCGGSGKTTLSRRLGELLELPVIHIDDQYWREVDGARVESTPEQWRQRHRELVARDRWVIDGMKLGVLEERLAAASAVIFLDLPAVVCLSGIARRWLRFRGHDRPELGVYVRVSWEFVRWVCSFRRRHRPRVLALLGAYGGHVVVLRRRRDVRRLVDQIGRRGPVSAQPAAPASHDCASTLPSSIVNVPPANGVGRSST